MMLSLGKETRELLGGIERPNDMKRKAAATVVRLKEGEFILVKDR
jgi:hypothetical protein